MSEHDDAPQNALDGGYMQRPAEVQQAIDESSVNIIAQGGVLNNQPRNNSALPGEGTITRQRSRASVREAAYVDAQETFKNAPRRVRRAMARKSVSLVVHMQKGKADEQV